MAAAKGAHVASAPSKGSQAMSVERLLETRSITDVRAVEARANPNYTTLCRVGQTLPYLDRCLGIN